MIKIDYNNKNEVNNLYIHDSEFKGYSYNYENRQIGFSCENRFLRKNYKFIFDNVIFCSMQSCFF